MEITELQKESYNDYPGKISSVIFTQGCNYNCGYCHNPELKSIRNGKISEEEVWKYLDSRKYWIGAIVLCGGEPTLQKDLPEFAKKAKEKGLAVKLDTNGSNPEMLKELLEKKLIDYVAMDVKAPTYFYPKVIGNDFDFWKNIRESMRVVSKFPNYEFRTTIAPILINGSLMFMDSEDVFNIAREIHETTWEDKHKYFLQPFLAIEKDGGNEIYLKKNLPKKMWKTPENLMEEAKKEAKKFLVNSEIRN
ncbi:7,8-dihydro-6-hydroxymethylpterin dimethyltransferase [uncultured archaeon]|nr:7,8-dihydro-6-hydroxymethylpterin dimethyltransferase [uncultured archaeon]